MQWNHQKPKGVEIGLLLALSWKGRIHGRRILKEESPLGALFLILSRNGISMETPNKERRSQRPIEYAS